MNEHGPSAEEYRGRERIAERTEVGELLRLHIVDVFCGVVFLLENSRIGRIGCLIALVQALTDSGVCVPEHTAVRALIAVEAMHREFRHCAVLGRGLDWNPSESRLY